MKASETEAHIRKLKVYDTVVIIRSHNSVPKPAHNPNRIK